MPGKFELAVELTRITFPYLIFISLVALFSGVLNSLTRFAVAAFAPALLNIALIVALLLVPDGGPATVARRWRSPCSSAACSSSPCAGRRAPAPASSCASAGRG